MPRFASLAYVSATAGTLVFAAATQAQTVDWNKQRAEILRHHRALIQIDSSSPAGNETKVTYSVESTLAGKLGSIGQPVLRSKAKDMEKIFASRLRAAFASTPTEDK